MPSYVKSHSLEMGPITDLIGRRVACVGLGNAYTQPIGYIIVKVQVDGVQGYNEDQIALIIPDLSNFMERIPVILGTPTISHIVNVMKEREIDALGKCQSGPSLVSAKGCSHNGRRPNMGKSSLDEYDEVVVTKNMKTVDIFSSCVIPMKVEKAYMGEHINVMTQALQAEDGSLPQGLTIQNAYTELRKGSKNTVMVVRNSTAYSQTVKKIPQWPGQWLQQWCQSCQQRPGCQRGRTSPKALTHLNWPFNRDKGSYLKSLIWVG